MYYKFLTETLLQHRLNICQKLSSISNRTGSYTTKAGNTTKIIKHGIYMPNSRNYIFQNRFQGLLMIPNFINQGFITIKDFEVDQLLFINISSESYFIKENTK